MDIKEVLRDIQCQISAMEYCHPVGDRVKWYTKDDMLLIISPGIYGELRRYSRVIFDRHIEKLCGVDFIVSKYVYCWKLFINSNRM